MVELALFKKALSTPMTLRPVSEGSILHSVQKDLRKWSVNLSIKVESEQFADLEKLLSELLVAQITDIKRIELMQKIYPNIARLIGQLHQHYIYATSIISSSQQVQLNQVKSLYYSSILVYRGIIDRELAKNNNSSKKSSKKFRVKKSRVDSNELLISIYKACDLYLNLLMEQSVTYQKSPTLYWGELNFLYKIAFVRGQYALDIRKSLGVSTPTTIQDIYKQACLHSLLGLSSYRRQDIVGVHKLLPEWAKHVRLTEDATSNFKLFVDLNDIGPPILLTPYSKVNPYEPDKHCLFLEISKLEEHLKQLIEQSADTAKPTPQLRLAKMAWYTLNTNAERHEQRRSSSDKAVIVSGFSLIHYYMAGKQPLSTLIKRHNLQRSYIPKYDTKPKEGYSKRNVNVELINTSTTGCRFKWNVKQEADDKTRDGNDLRVLSLFAIQKCIAGKNTTGRIHDGQWQIGIVRWIENHEDSIEAGARIIAHSATACGLRLDKKDNRSQDFVPALLLARDDNLGTKTTLLVPYYHFRVDDKVILRIGEKQTQLKLQQLISSSDDFEQYEIIRIG